MPSQHHAALHFITLLITILTGLKEKSRKRKSKEIVKKHLKKQMRELGLREKPKARI